MVVRVLSAGATAALGVAINLATDNIKSVLAWLLVLAAVILVAMVTPRVQRYARSAARIKGERNTVEQRGAGADKRARVSGKDNQLRQTDT